MLEVLEAGLLTTVQDGGRLDAVDLGVPVGGACDQWSLAVANALAGNEIDVAALEMAVLGGTFRAVEACAVALAGADMGGPVGVGRSFRLAPGEVLELGPAREGSGVRGYLALAGGIDVPQVLGSRSTCLVGGFGGLDGRPLRAGDVLRSLPAAGVTDRTWPGRPSPMSGPGPHVVRVVEGPDAGLVSGGLASLLDRQWTVSGRGDRQGIVLDGPIQTMAGTPSLLSRGVTWGTVQLPPDGRPIILLADHQTVGGYPAVAVVIRADLPLAGQLGAGDELRFVAVTIDEAQAALRTQAREFERLAGMLS